MHNWDNIYYYLEVSFKKIGNPIEEIGLKS